MKSGATARIQALANSSTKAEAQVINYICKHADAVPYQSVQALAGAAGVSVASVCRMAQHAGYSSFKEFKIALLQETATPGSSVFQAVTDRDTDEEVIRKVFRGNIQSLQNTLKMLDTDDCLNVAQMIINSDRTVFFGIASSGLVAREAALRFLHLDAKVESCIESYEILVRASHMKKGQVAIGISHSGRTSAVVEALRLASGNGATTIGISNYMRSPLRSVSSIFFCTSFKESGVYAASLSAMIAQMCLIDALYVLIARHEKTVSRVKRVNQVVEKFLRIPEKRR
jgi:DNA-binding MurR/RpiR family transcriptional regulator